MAFDSIHPPTPYICSTLHKPLYSYTISEFYESFLRHSAYLTWFASNARWRLPPLAPWHWASHQSTPAPSTFNLTLINCLPSLSLILAQSFLTRFLRFFPSFQNFQFPIALSFFISYGKLHFFFEQPNFWLSLSHSCMPSYEFLTPTHL